MRSALKLALLSLAVAAPLAAGGLWRAQAVATVNGPGLTELVLPAHLHFRFGEEFELSLNDLKGNAVPFELYWREDAGSSVRTLEASSVNLRPGQGYVWEAPLPKDLQLETLHIQARDGAAVGAVDVDVRQQGTWVRLASDAALTDDGGGPACTLKIKGGTAVRLHFQGYNQEFKQSVAPLDRVEVQGKPTKVDYVRRWVALGAEELGPGQVRLRLPGLGLQGNRLRLRGRAPYVGAWTLSTIDARRGAQVLAQGRTRGLGKEPLQLDIELPGALAARALLLTLDAPAAKTFALDEAKLEVRMPRLVFHAPAPGAYALLSLPGQRVRALDSPNDEERRVVQKASLSAVDENIVMSHVTEVLGAPFGGEGYAWSAPVEVPKGGAYRLALGLEAALDPHPASLRLVKDGVQMLFVRAEDDKEESLDLKLEESFDAKTNVSTYALSLPRASNRWKSLRLQAQGSFKRSYRLEQPKPSGSGYDLWQQGQWQQSSSEGLVLPLQGMRVQGTQFRLVVSHGDNQRISLSQAQATYDAPALLFMASQAGTLQLLGGSASALAPDYDLSIFDMAFPLDEPTPLTLGPVKPYAGQSAMEKLKISLGGHKNSGLYWVLGLVTLGLLVLIIRILPKAEA